MSSVMRGRAKQVDTVLKIIEQAAEQAEAAAVAWEEVQDLDDEPAIDYEVVMERLESALQTMEESVATMREQLDDMEAAE
ncbi:MAG: hypothetical protein F4147_12260 [Gammaproteobacteria bacterium]|nr:hypothetical protein [Gammaproteobacteria bacterium]